MADHQTRCLEEKWAWLLSQPGELGKLARECSNLVNSMKPDVSPTHLLFSQFCLTWARITSILRSTHDVTKFGDKEKNYEDSWSHFLNSLTGRQKKTPNPVVRQLCNDISTKLNTLLKERRPGCNMDLAGVDEVVEMIEGVWPQMRELSEEVLKENKDFDENGEDWRLSKLQACLSYLQSKAENEDDHGELVLLDFDVNFKPEGEVLTLMKEGS